MSGYLYLFYPTLNAIKGFNRGLLLAGMILIIFLFAWFIVKSVFRLLRIFNNLDHSARQTRFIIIRFLLMILSGYCIYELTTLVLALAN